jgi:hypothetical protein
MRASSQRQRLIESELGARGDKPAHASGAHFAKRYFPMVFRPAYETRDLDSRTMAPQVAIGGETRSDFRVLAEVLTRRVTCPPSVTCDVSVISERAKAARESAKAKHRTIASTAR